MDWWIRDSESKTNMALDSSGGCIVIVYLDMGVSLNGGFPQQLLVFQLKMTILGCFGGTPFFGNTHIGFSQDQMVCILLAACFSTHPLNLNFWIQLGRRE